MVFQSDCRVCSQSRTSSKYRVDYSKFCSTCPAKRCPDIFPSTQRLQHPTRMCPWAQVTIRSLPPVTDRNLCRPARVMTRSQPLERIMTCRNCFSVSSTDEIAPDSQMSKTEHPSGWAGTSVDTSRRCVQTTVLPPFSPWPDAHHGTYPNRKAQTACDHPRQTRMIARTPGMGHRRHHPLRHRPDNRPPHPAKRSIHPTSMVRTPWTRLRRLHHNQHRSSSQFAPIFVLFSWG